MDSIDFPLESTGLYAAAFYQRGIHQFADACQYIQNLPYKRTSSPDNLLLVLEEQCGTCTSKHALLAGLAHEQDRTEIHLTIGMYPMGPNNTPELKGVLPEELSYVPEAHVYLMHNGTRYDFTRPQSIPLRDEEIFKEYILLPEEIVSQKTSLHKAFIADWCTKDCPFSEQEIWHWREKCIEKLSE